MLLIYSMITFKLSNVNVFWGRIFFRFDVDINESNLSQEELREQKTSEKSAGDQH